MGLIPKIRVDEYFYELPDDRIALFPASPKDSAKCLVYDGASILDCNFQSLPNYLEKDSNFVINDTEVIPARIWFTTESGVSIQIFLLKMLDQSAHIWEVLVGNRRRFKEGISLLLEDNKFNLVCKWKDRERNIIELESNQSVMSAIEHFGKVPLPPYIVREVKESDKGDYQTVFAKEKGAVAAPTASLHFTEDLISSIKDGRYEEQSHRLSYATRCPNHRIIYIIEGNMNTLCNPNEYKLVNSAITSLNVYKGFSVLRTLSVRETAKLIIHMMEKIIKNTQKGVEFYDRFSDVSGNSISEKVNIQPSNYCNLVKKVKKDNITPDNIGEIILSQIPGVSSVTAIAIMSNFKSFYNLVESLQKNPSCLENLTITKNDKTRKISKKVLEDIKRFLLYIPQE